MTPTPVVEFTRVTKDYPRGLLGRGRLRAVEEVSFRIAPGEVFGLLGPNRAGKTTLVKLLLSLCRPTSGQVCRFGRPGADRGSLRRVGYVHENQAFPRYLTASGLLYYYGAMSLVPAEVLSQRVPALLERVGLADRAHEPIARFSKGMVQRLGIAQALIGDPELLVLDEPSEGLDLAGRQLVRELLQAQKRQGRSALFVSHVLPEAEHVCDRIAVINAGRLAHVSSLDALLGAGSKRRPLEAAVEPFYNRSPQLTA
jgi:ABC-2 type transport system ATP-binding protein